MSGRNEVEFEVSNFIYGVTTTGNPRDIPRGGAQKLANAELIKPGIVSKARGYTPIGQWLDNRVYELLNFVRSGIDVVLMFGINSSGTTAGVGMLSGTWASGNVVTSVLTGLVVTEQVSLVQAGDEAYFFDGSNDSYYDGTSWTQIGLTSPSAAPVSAGLYDGSLTDSGQYLCEIRRYNSSTGARSKPSPVSLQMTAGTSGASTAGISITFDAGDSSQADYTEIYRTVAGGTKMYREGSVAIAVTGFNLEMSDATLTQQNRAETGDDLPPDMRIVRAGGDEMLGVETDNPNRVRWNKYSSQYGSMFQSWPPLNFADVEVAKRDVIKAVHYNDGVWFVFKEHSMGKLVEAGGGVRYYQKLSDWGIVGIRAMTSFGRWTVWWGPDNVYITDGFIARQCGGGLYGLNIQDDIKSLAKGQGNRICACTVNSRSQIRFSVIPSGQSHPKKIYVGHYQFWESKGFMAWTTREEGPAPSTQPGIQASAMRVIPDSDNQDQFLFGNSNGDGYIYKGDYGDSDNGSAIYSDWQFHREDLGNSRKNKTFADYEVEVKTERSTTQVILGIRRNGQETIETVRTITVGSDGFLLDTDSLVQLADDTGGVSLGSDVVEPVNIPLNREAKDVTIVIRNAETNYIELRRFTQRGMYSGNR